MNASSARGGLAKTFVHGALDFLPALAGAFLDAADEFIRLAIHILQVVIRQLSPFLFQLTLGNVPVAFVRERIHRC